MSDARGPRFLVVWADVPGQPLYADEQLVATDDLESSDDGCGGLVAGWPLKRGRQPRVNCRVRKGTWEQLAVHQFLDRLCESMNQTTRTGERQSGDPGGSDRADSATLAASKPQAHHGTVAAPDRRPGDAAAAAMPIMARAPGSFPRGGGVGSGRRSADV